MPTLTQLLQLVYQVWAFVQGISAKVDWFLNGIRVGGVPLGSPGWSEEWNTTYNVTLASAELLADATSGLAAAHTERLAILAAIGAITPTPPAPPPSQDDIATAVWRALDPNSIGGAGAYGDEQFEPYARAVTMNQGGAVLVAASMHWSGWGYFGNVHAPAELNDPPVPDWSAILPTDTRLTWLERTETRFTFAEDPDTHVITGYRTAGTGAVTFTFDLSEREFQQLMNPGATSAPVWPGLGKVTLGTPVALAPGVTITEPMDGVLVSISAVDPKQMFYTYDDLRAYRHIGALAFLSDDGQAEAWQSLGFVAAVYVPRALAQAAAVKILTAQGTVGTVTPWVRT